MSWDEKLGPKLKEWIFALASVEHYYNQEVFQYKNERSSKYPSVEDQLDQIFHGALLNGKKPLKAIKDAHPKTTVNSEELERRKQEVRITYLRIINSQIKYR